MALPTGDPCSGTDHDEAFRLLYLPKELLHEIISYLTFDDISKNRQVCRTFEIVCSSQLNRGFQHVERLLNQMQRDVRTKLPRRESERRNHSMARHADILSAIETRLSLLQITYSKYIESGYCCFIPGKVLDEMLRVLRYVHQEPSPRRSHEVLQELRDISSMAMEHFDEKILPGVKARMQAQGVAVLPGGFTVSIDERPVVIHGAHSPAAVHQASSSAAAVGRFGEPDVVDRPGAGCSPSVAGAASAGMLSPLAASFPLASGRLRSLAAAGAAAAGCSCSGAIAKLQVSSGAHTAGMQSLRLDLGWLRNKLLDLERVCLRRERRAHRQEALVSEQARQLAQQRALIYMLTMRVNRLESRSAAVTGLLPTATMATLPSSAVFGFDSCGCLSLGGTAVGGANAAAAAALRKRPFGDERVAAAACLSDDEAAAAPPASKRCATCEEPHAALSDPVDAGPSAVGQAAPSLWAAAGVSACCAAMRSDLDGSLLPASSASGGGGDLRTPHVRRLQPPLLPRQPRRLLTGRSSLNTRARATKPAATTTAAAAAVATDHGAEYAEAD